MSPLPEQGVAATSSDAATTPLDTATVDECTVLSHDEETFAESTLEQRTAFERRLETFEEERQDDGHVEEEIVEEVATVQKSEFVDDAHQRRRGRAINQSVIQSFSCLKLNSKHSIHCSS